MIQIYGASDDLIEIEGDIREEFYLPNADTTYLGLSTGHLVKVSYDGEWYFKVIRSRSSIETIYPIDSEKAKEISGDDYSEVFELDEVVSWVLMGMEFVK